MVECVFSRVFVPQGVKSSNFNSLSCKGFVWLSWSACIYTTASYNKNVDLIFVVILFFSLNLGTHINISHIAPTHLFSSPSPHKFFSAQLQYIIFYFFLLCVSLCIRIQSRAGPWILVLFFLHELIMNLNYPKSFIKLEWSLKWFFNLLKKKQFFYVTPKPKFVKIRHWSRNRRYNWYIFFVVEFFKKCMV